MPFSEIASVIIACVLMNHMGLIDKIESIIKHRLPVIDCVKCSTFWAVLVCCLISRQNAIHSVAVSFLSSYAALWLELAFGVIDKKYEEIYEKTYQSQGTGEADSESSEDAVSEVRQVKKTFKNEKC